MKLNVLERAKAKKCDVKRIRREGNIPAILYSSGHPCESILLNGVEFETILREMKSGRLSTSIFTLLMNGKERKAIIKDIQHNLTNYQVMHVDFEELRENVPVNVKVPIFFTGTADCVGVKLGGFLRQVIRSIKVECLPKQIPDEFVIDVSTLGIRQSKRLRDLDLPKGVRLLAPSEEVVVVVARK